MYTYIGLGHNIKEICTEHFPSSFITIMFDYIHIDKNKNVNKKDSNLEV